MNKIINKTICFLFAGLALLNLKSNSQNQTLFEKKANEYVRPFAETKNFNGAILVAQKGKILYNKAFGMANQDFDILNKPDTKFHIASVSKNFTAAAILLLEQRNLLKVTDTISKYVSDLPYGNKITIHQLLTHTSGIPNINNMPEYDTVVPFPQTPESLINVFKNKPLDFTPGTKYSYSNSNYNILAYIIQKVSHMNYGDFLAENIFKPLAMQNTGHHKNAGMTIKNSSVGYQADGNFGLEKSSYLDWTSKTGNGSLYSTIEDLYKWDRALYTEKILSKNSIEKMYVNYGGFAGYGCFVKEQFNKKWYYMNGRSPGFTSYFARYPDDDVCIIVLANNYVPVVTQIGTNIAAILFGEKYEIPQLNAAKVDEKIIKEVIGQYQFDDKFYRPNFIMTVSQKDGHLITDWEELIPKADFNYIGRTYWSEINFVKDKNGVISAMTYDSFKAKKL